MSFIRQSNLRTLASALLFALLFSTASWAHRPAFQTGEHIGPHLAPFVAPIGSVSGTWTPLANFPPDQVDTGLLLTDGTVMMHVGSCTGKWLRLTPDNTGSYVNGTWRKIASMPSGYEPLYFASQVLRDGSVIVNGGEYNHTKCDLDHTKLSAIYDPVTNTWTSVTVPKAWAHVGDAQSVVLASGLYMLTNCCDFQEATAVVSGTTVTWTTVNNQWYPNEESWTLLPDNSLITVDVWTNAGKNHDDSELFGPKTETWSMGNRTASQLTNTTTHELGASVLRPDGTVFQAGANPCNDPKKCAAHTGIYTFVTGVWTSGPDFPMISSKYYDEADGPAAVLPDGNVLVEASPGEGKSPTHFFEFDGTNLIRVSEPHNAPSTTPFTNRMLELPTGQILWTDGGFDIEVYKESGSPKSSWAPVITKSPGNVTRGNKNYQVSGNMFNGLSQGAAYGDDAQMASNYPLVRISNRTTGRVCFGRTHDFATGLSASPKKVTTTDFDFPSASPPAGTQPCDAGASKLQVIVNGIASKAVSITVN